MRIDDEDNQIRQLLFGKQILFRANLRKKSSSEYLLILTEQKLNLVLMFHAHFPGKYAIFTSHLTFEK